MQLYFSPLACSLATRIALYETGAKATFVEVDPKTKRTQDGQDYREINPLGFVPTIRTDDGDILSENAAILQHVAERWPEARLAPTERKERERLQQWLCFIGTELHKAVFTPLLDPAAPEGAKAYALGKATSRLDLLEKHLSGREFLLQEFSVADAYLFAVLGWCVATPVDLKKWPALVSYVSSLRERPSIAQAFREERTLYSEYQARNPTKA
ncbi:glutathione S-transferase N-terminal domain-containing protein [Myxococcus sp. CA051A]|uniref:glutathione S-transferase N-terminal domain-containing protein n=1 Tax=Myxococcus sp. CA051A TaxID=2741739 RepID=UPI00157B9899|nr:glutathione S-transferase N-terminal domain-containing protein [Myxococcus sp. CA051A]NTX64205.1 glutathione S-transferase N-terminal domain-containing protein [Myxococcus sp. CA051A]